jgi:hypothetical protein
MAACSLLLPAGNLDEDYGKDGGGGTLGDSGMDAAQGCAACAFGCDAGHCVPRTLRSYPPNALACASSWVYVVGDPQMPQNIPGLLQLHNSVDAGITACPCLGANDPAANSTGYKVAVGAGKVVWRTYDSAAGDQLWWIDDGDCCSGPQSANPVPVPAMDVNASTTGDFGWGIATDGVYVYWLSKTGVEKALLSTSDAGEPAISVAMPGGSSPELSGLALAPDGVFFNVYGASSIYEQPLDGGALRSWSDVMSATQGRGIQTDGKTSVVWADIHPPNAGQIHGLSLAVPGAQPQALATLDDPEGLALDSNGNVFVSEQSTGAVVRFPFSSPANQTTLWQVANGSPSNLCTDGEFVYFIAAGGVVQVDATHP